MCVCVFIHIQNFLWMPKRRKKILLLILSLANTKHFMLSTKHIFCVFTSESGSDILDLIRALHESRGNVQVLLLYRNFQWSKLYSYGRFSGPGRHFIYLKVFLEFLRNAVFVSFGNGLEFGPGGLQDDKRVLEDEKNEKKSHHQTDLI